jgi:hypothetical protein
VESEVFGEGLLSGALGTGDYGFNHVLTFATHDSVLPAGMHYALKALVPTAEVKAFDINDTANDVYEFNFGTRPWQVCRPLKG